MVPEQGAPLRSEQSESQGWDGGARARPGKAPSCGSVLVGSCVGPSSRDLWCAQDSKSSWGSPSKSRWGPCFLVLLDQLVVSLGNDEGYLHTGPHALAPGSLGPPPLSWSRDRHSSYRLGVSVLSKQMPWLLCSRGPWAPRVSGGTSPPSGLPASGLRTSTEGLSWLGARWGHQLGLQCLGWVDQAMGRLLSMACHLCAV